MRWIAKDAPIYVWKKDCWFNERDGNVYTPDLERQAWVFEDKVILFPKKAKVMKECE